MKKKKNKNKGLIWIFLIGIIGCILITIGTTKVIKTKTYSETIGMFSKSEQHTSYSTSTTKRKSKYYIWYYDFFVNDKKYTAESDSQVYEEPTNKETKILYNPVNPNENIIDSDYTRYALIVVGFIFVCIPAFFAKSDKREDNTKKGAWYLLLFSCSMLLILLLEVNFNMLLLITTMLPFTLVLCIFIGVGILLLRRAYNTNYNLSSENNKIENMSTSKTRKE